MASARERTINQLDALISQIYFSNETTCFGQFLCPSSRNFRCTNSNGICHTGLLTASEQEQMLLLTCCQQTCMTYTIAVCTVKAPDDGQRNCPKHVDFNSKNKFEILVHLVGFILRVFCLYQRRHSRGTAPLVLEPYVTADNFK